MIRVRDLTHRFDRHAVLKGISLDIEKGETVAIMGTSGGGKTTLLRCMSGLLQPSEGTVELLGINPYTCNERELYEVRKKTGIVFQGSALFDYLDVASNISFGLVRHSGLSKDKIGDIVDQKLQMVGLAGEENKMPSDLSGGMKKRVGVARALATDPEIIFYDEPTSGLDPVTAYSMDSLIREVADKVHTTSVVITHDLHSVLRVADRVVFLSEGVILSDGPPEKFTSSTDPHIQEVIRKAEAESLS